jgi:glycolate oxidase iron-sulfur subunit
MNIELKLEEQIKACIHCGMCLPACPTYNVSFNEANSPRGRIYLINDIIKEETKLDKEKTIEYLDNCLSCFACETVCPSNVDYADILHYARQDLKYTKYNKGIFAFIRKLFFKFIINNRSLLRLMRLNLKFSSFLIRPLMKAFGLTAQAKLMPKLDKPYKTIHEEEIFYSDVELNLPTEKRIINFSLGCVMDTIYNDVHWDTIYVLNAFGFHVHISSSKCCGSLPEHSGEFKIAAKLKKDFCQTVQSEGLALVTNSAGCGAFLKEVSGGMGVYDLIEILKKAPYNPLKEKTFNGEILYHPACHLNHRQGVSGDYEKLFASVQGLQVFTLDQKDTCCGSGGFYNLIKSDMAQKVGTLKADEITKSNIKTLVTANPGCMSQIKAHLADDFVVLHPVTLLKRILEANSSLRGEA